MRVRRWTRTSGIFTAAVGVVAVALALVPFNFGSDVIQKLTSLLILIILATMWNALAGYGGLVSVGQQAFIGVGAYATLYFAGQGVPPYVAMLLAAVFSGLLALAISPFALRLRGAQFAIGMWVTAEILRILVTLNSSLGGGTGLSLIQLNQYDPIYQQAFTMWIALGFAVVLIATLFILLRSRMGTSLQAIRDDEEAAQSLGVRVGDFDDCEAVKGIGPELALEDAQHLERATRILARHRTAPTSRSRSASTPARTTRSCTRSSRTPPVRRTASHRSRRSSTTRSRSSRAS